MSNNNEQVLSKIYHIIPEIMNCEMLLSQIMVSGNTWYKYINCNRRDKAM